MKLRRGFVSNSSSSSFVVTAVKRDILTTKEERLITKKEEKTLKDYGFRYCGAELLVHLDGGLPENLALDKPDPEFDVRLHYHVHCNQGDVFDWLLRKGIPFKAVTSNGALYYYYERSSKTVLRLYNFGIEYDWFGRIPSEPGKSAVQRIRVKDILSRKVNL